MTLSRIQKLESLGFEWEWDSRGTAWEDRLSELADYRKMHGHCNVPRIYSETQSWLRGLQPKRTTIGCTKKERNRL
jgi:hypothetical protein